MPFVLLCVLTIMEGIFLPPNVWSLLVIIGTFLATIRLIIMERV